MQSDSYVYAISYDVTGPCKIGLAWHPWSRCRELQVGNHQDLRVSLAMIPDIPACEVEAELHSLFADRSIRGEWFDASVAEVMEMMACFGTVVASPKEEPRQGYVMMPDELGRVMLAHPRYMGKAAAK